MKHNSRILLIFALFLLLLPLASCSDNKSQGNQSQGGQYPGAQAQGNQFPGGQATRMPAGNQGGGVFLMMHQEQYQGAFTLLIPRGWRAEGGMIPSGVSWNVVDLIETNIKFRVTSPDGKSFFGWYPRFYFQDPSITTRSSMGYMKMKTGQTINGLWLFPYMSIEQYVQQIVFRYFSAKEFQNPRLLGKAQPSPELRPLVPNVATHYQAGYVNFEFSMNGTPMFGRIYTIMYNIQNYLWTTVGTWGMVAPKDRWAQEERVMEICMRSFRLNPQWVAKAAAAEKQRGQKFNEVTRYMARVDQEIAQNRAQTRSDIVHENYKLLTGQIETRDPSTGNIKYLPSYNNAYTDGRGNYFLKDHDDGTLPVDNAGEWRKLDIVNRLVR